MFKLMYFIKTLLFKDIKNLHKIVSIKKTSIIRQYIIQ
jgi:hypothetical protein